MKIYLLLSTLAILFVVGLFAHQRQVGALQFRIREAEAEINTLQKIKKGKDKEYIFKTDTFVKVLYRRDTTLKVVEKFLHDTIPVPVEVVKQIIAVDSAAIQSCRSVVLTCEQRVAVRNSIISQKNDQLVAYKKLSHSWFYNRSIDVIKIGTAFYIGTRIK